MTSIIKTPLKTALINSIYTDLISKSARYHYFIGKSSAWAGGDITPETPADTYNYELSTRNNLILTKQLNTNDVSFVIPRYDWITNTVFAMYDDQTTALHNSNFYVVTSEFNVYKCIFNNNGAVSTVKPAGQDSTSQTYADGYIWKFMYNIPVALRNKFMTSTLMPVTTALNNQFYSNGELNSITIENGGSGYTSATIAITGDGYLEENPYILSSITITNGGAGYVSPPTLTISAPSITIGTEIQATASATISGGIVNTASIGITGYGYDNTATLTVTPPFSGTEYLTNAAVTNGVYLIWLGNFYQVSGTGTTGVVPPTHTSGSVANGTVSLVYAGTQAVLTLNKTKTNAQVTAILGSGQITGYTITDAGVGYSYANITVTGNGTGAELVANLSIGDINTIQSNVELLAINGSIESANVITQGSGYTTATALITGDGTGATATAVILNGSINKVLINNVGSGYTWASITISGDGTGATARAIMSPNGGHGKNSITELFAKSLIFYTTISTEKNQGLVVTNDFRQVGLIKNLNQFNSNIKSRKILGTACFKVTGTINTTQFPNDAIIFNNTTNKRYYIVQSYTTSMILLPLDNEIPIAGVVYRNDAMNTVITSSVVNPTIDKYSGELMFIDNKLAFTPDSSQTAILKTVLNF